MAYDEFVNKYKTYYKKSVIVYFEDGTIHKGRFNEVFEEDNSVLVGGMEIPINDIKKMELSTD